MDTFRNLLTSAVICKQKLLYGNETEIFKTANALNLTKTILENLITLIFDQMENFQDPFNFRLILTFKMS